MWVSERLLLHFGLCLASHWAHVRQDNCRTYCLPDSYAHRYAYHLPDSYAHRYAYHLPHTLPYSSPM